MNPWAAAMATWSSSLVRPPLAFRAASTSSPARRSPANAAASAASVGRRVLRFAGLRRLVAHWPVVCRTQRPKVARPGRDLSLALKLLPSPARHIAVNRTRSPASKGSPPCSASSPVPPSRRRDRRRGVTRPRHGAARHHAPRHGGADRDGGDRRARTGRPQSVEFVDESGSPLANITVVTVEPAWTGFGEDDEPESGHEYLRITVLVESRSPRGCSRSTKTTSSSRTSTGSSPPATSSPPPSRPPPIRNRSRM